MTAAELEAMDARAVNWGRWSRAGCGLQRMTCASAEGRYVAPRPDDERVTAAGREPLDVDGAERFERAVCSLPGQFERKFLVMVYVVGRPRAEVARRFRLASTDMVEAFRRRALGAVSERMGSPDEVRLIRRGRPLWAGNSGRG